MLWSARKAVGSFHKERRSMCSNMQNHGTHSMPTVLYIEIQSTLLLTRSGTMEQRGVAGSLASHTKPSAYLDWPGYMQQLVLHSLPRTRQPEGSKKRA